MRRAASSLVCAAFFVFMGFEARRLGMKHTWLLIPYALFVALASAVPLFFLLRARRLETRQA